MSQNNQKGSKQRNPFRKIWFTSVATLIFFIASTMGALAADPGHHGEMDGPISPEPVDVLCVSGMVINHEEQPLEGWTVRAIYEGTMGTYPEQTTTTGPDGTFRFDLPGTGRWAFEVDVPDGWEAVTPVRFAVHAKYGHLDCVPIRFKLRQYVEVIVYKIDDHHNPLEGWIIIATPGPDNLFATQQRAVTGPGGIARFYLTPGEWTFSEEAPDGIAWWRPISPPTGRQTIIVRPNGPIEIRFKNMVVPIEKGCIDVFKGDVPVREGERSFGLQGWPIQILRTDGSIAAQGRTDAFGEITFKRLPYGPYTVQEIVLPGWEPVTPTTYNVFLTSRDDGCQRIEFYNKQKDRGYCFEGQKIDNLDGVGLPGWIITATPLHDGGYTPDPVVTDGDGRYRIDLPLEDYRIPNAAYEVCEEAQEGWESVGPSCYTVTLPRYEDICTELPPFINKQSQHDGYDHKPDHGYKRDPGHGNYDGPYLLGKDNQGTVAPKGKDVTCRATHIVRPNDSVSRIASYYGVSSGAVMQANPWIRNQRNSWLYVGQQICIP